MRVLQEVGFHDFVDSPSFVLTSPNFFLFDSKISKLYIVVCHLTIATSITPYLKPDLISNRFKLVPKWVPFNHSVLANEIDSVELINSMLHIFDISTCTVMRAPSCDIGIRLASVEQIAKCVRVLCEIAQHKDNGRCVCVYEYSM